MAYYWRAEDVPELAEVARADRKLWWHIACKQSSPGIFGHLSSPWFWFFLFLAFKELTRRFGQGLSTDIACMAMALFAAFVVDVCLSQPRRRHWLREHMCEYRDARPWLQAAANEAASECGGKVTARYWRLNDIPELHDVPPTRRRKLWSEAVSRSTTPQVMLGTMLVVFVAGAVAGGACSVFFPSVSPLWAVLPAMACASLVVDRWFRWPAACRWLREHAHELDRYVPA